MTIWNCLFRLFIQPPELLFEFLFSFLYRHMNEPGPVIVLLGILTGILFLPLFRRLDEQLSGDLDPWKKLRAWAGQITKKPGGEETSAGSGKPRRNRRPRQEYIPAEIIIPFVLISFFTASYHFFTDLQTLAGEPFGPIRDLGTEDLLLHIAGIPVNFLPFIPAAILFISIAVFGSRTTRKSRIRMYLINLIFVILLYRCPSGLVLFWTTVSLCFLFRTFRYFLGSVYGHNNLLRYAEAGMIIAALALLNYGLFSHDPGSIKKTGLLTAAIIVLLLLLLHTLRIRPFRAVLSSASKEDDRLFLLGCIFMTILTGIIIPSAVIRSSPEDFIYISAYYSPLWYILSALLTAAGTFIIWFGAFHKLSSSPARKIMSLGMLLLSLCSAVNYLNFGTNRGTLSNQLVYEVYPSDPIQKVLINTAVLIEISALVYCVWKKKADLFNDAFVMLCLAASVMSVINTVNITKQLSGIDDKIKTALQSRQSIRLSKDGKNVVILMMDRAIGYFVPYIMAEKPELQQKFDGFTFYSNTMSYGATTNSALPALFGGYEYTPAEINKRDKEPLVKKHNESLLMLPVLFTENGYEATVIEPSHANYQWIPDLSIYDDYPDIKAYLMSAFYTQPNIYQASIDTLNRNFFCFSLYKTAPLALQPILYTGGLYNDPDLLNGRAVNTLGTQQLKSPVSATGLTLTFYQNYDFLMNLPVFTVIDESEGNTFLEIVNKTTHDPILLQMPDYEPSYEVNNEEYEDQPITRRAADGSVLELGTTKQITHYHANMVSFLALAHWMDHLRENGVYDNTRIIIAADHGFPMGFPGQQFGPAEFEDILSYNPVLMVKDFGSSGFQINDRFMTNAEVPTIAMEGLIDSPENPYTGMPVVNDPVEDPVHEIYHTRNFNVTTNNGNVFQPGDWFALHGKNIFDPESWELLGFY